MKRVLACLACAAWLGVCFATLAARQDDQPAAPRGGGRGAGAGGGRSTQVTTPGSFDQAQVARGQAIFGAQCASCHGPDPRGGSGKADVDLMRQSIVFLDITGKTFADFVTAGHPRKNPARYDVTREQAVDIQSWLRYQAATFVSGRGGPPQSVFSGDARAGEVFFDGPIGRCATCHSVTGDLKGIGQRTNGSAPALQAAILSGSTGAARGGGRGGGRAAGGAPTAEAANPLQAHRDLMLKYTDANIHDLAAYLRDK